VRVRPKYKDTRESVGVGWCCCSIRLRGGDISLVPFGVVVLGYFCTTTKFLSLLLSEEHSLRCLLFSTLRTHAPALLS